MLSSRGRSYLCLAQMYSSAGRSCLWLSKCKEVIHCKVSYLELSKCYPVEGGYLCAQIVQGGRVYGCLNVIHCKEGLSKYHPVQGGLIPRTV